MCEMLRKKCNEINYSLLFHFTFQKVSDGDSIRSPIPNLHQLYSNEYIDFSSNGEYMFYALYTWWENTCIILEVERGTLGAHWIKIKKNLLEPYILLIQTVSKLMRPLRVLGALIAHVWDPLGALNGPPNPPFQFFASPNADSRLRTCHDKDMLSGVMS